MWSSIMRSITILLCVFLFTSLTGCAIPRAVGLHCLALDTAPLMQGDERVQIDIDPWVYISGTFRAQTRIYSDHPAPEILDFYRKHFAAKGWIEVGQSKEQSVPDFSKTARWYRFHRTRALIGTCQKVILSREHLTFVIDITRNRDDPKNKIKAEFIVHGSYLWDAPCRIPMWFLGKLCGESSLLASPLFVLL